MTGWPVETFLLILEYSVQFVQPCRPSPTSPPPTLVLQKNPTCPRPTRLMLLPKRPPPHLSFNGLRLIPAFAAASSVCKHPPKRRIPSGSTHVHVRWRRTRIVCCDGFQSTSARAPKHYGAPLVRARYRPPSPKTASSVFETGYTRCTVVSLLRYCWASSRVVPVGSPPFVSSLSQTICPSMPCQSDGLQSSGHFSDASVVVCLGYG